MPHSPEEKKRALARVRRLRGQLEAIERTLEAGADCSAVLQQIAAVRGAVNGLMAWILEAHVRESLGDPDLDPQTRTKNVDELNSLIRSYLK